jgi:site-specific recombinase XerD
MEHLIDAYLASRSYSPASVKHRRAVFAGLTRHFDPATGTAEQYLAWWASKSEQAPATRRSAWQATRGLLTWLNVAGVRTDNPADLVRPPKVPKAPPKVLTSGQVHDLRQSLTSHSEQLMVELMLSCGLRIAECARVDADDLDRELEFLRVAGKGGKVAMVPVPADIVAIWPEAGTGPVFGVVPNTMHARVKKVLARAGIEDHTAHSLRRTCATEMARRNVPMHVVAAVLRHDTPATTLNWYTAVSNDDLRKAIGE